MSAISRPKASVIGRWLPGLIISLIAILLLVRSTDWSDLFKAISEIDLAYFFPALLFFIASLLLRALTWMILLQRKAGYTRVFITLNEGYLLNNIFPFRLGELGRAFILSRTAKLSGFFVLSTIVIERTYDIAIAAGLLLATIPNVFSFGNNQTIAISVLLIMMLGLAGMYLMARNRQFIRGKLDQYSANRIAIRHRIVPRIDSVLRGFEVLTSLDQFLLSFTLIAISWIFGGIELILLSKSFGVDLQIWMVAFILGVISLGIAIPSAPAGLGVYEFAMVAAFSLLGLSTTAALAIALVTHFISIGLTGLVGMYGLFRDGESISGLYQRLRGANVLKESS